MARQTGSGIPITNSFDVNTPFGIDSRNVKANLVDRNSIGFKFDGLECYVEATKTKYTFVLGYASYSLLDNNNWVSDWSGNNIVIPGVYTKVTVNERGRVTSGTDATPSDILGLLDNEGKINADLMPAISIIDTFVRNTEAGMLSLDAQQGDICIRTDENQTYILTNDNPASLSSWQALLNPIDGVTSITLAMPGSEFNITNPTITSNGIITVNWKNQAERSVFAAPLSGTGVPTFRSLSISDIPDLATNYIQNNSGTTPQDASINISGIIKSSGMTSLGQVTASSMVTSSPGITGNMYTYIDNGGSALLLGDGLTYAQIRYQPGSLPPDSLGRPRLWVNLNGGSANLGVIAYTDDITSTVAGYVPYTGATTSLDLGLNDLGVNHITTGTDGMSMPNNVEITANTSRLERLRLNQIPVTDITPTKLITRDEVTGELKQIDLTTFVDSSHIFDGMQIKGGSVDAFPVSKHLVINAVDPGPLRMHLEPKGFIENGLASKLDFMMDPYDQGLASYRLVNIFTRVGTFAGLNGENGLAFFGTKSTGEHVPQYPSLHIGFNDDAADAVPMKVYYFESTAAATWLKPMRGVWRAGMVINTNDYVNVGLRLYKALGTGTAGITKPVHTSGTANDGNIDFEYIRSVVTGSMRPVVIFGDRDLMPLRGLPDTRAQFALNATFWNGSKLEFASSTNNRHYDIGTTTGADDLIIRNIISGQTLTMASLGGIVASGNISALNLSGTNTGDQTLTSSDGGMLTLSGIAAVRVSSIGNKAYANANVMDSVPGIYSVYTSSTIPSINYPAANGGGIRFQNVASSGLGYFELWKSRASGIDDLYFRTGAGSTTFNNWDIIAGRTFVASNYTKIADTISSAPTPTSTGVKGQIIITGGYRYECINTNIWVRHSVILTW